MVPEKGQPPFAWVTAAVESSKIASDGPFGDDEAELLKFAVNLGGSPTRILCREAQDQRPDLFGDSRPAAAGPRSPTPVQPKTDPVPADDGLGLDDDQNIGPAGPEAADGGPEEPVQ